MKRLLSLTLVFFLLLACTGCVGRAAAVPGEEEPNNLAANLPDEAPDAAQPDVPEPAAPAQDAETLPDPELSHEEDEAQGGAEDAGAAQEQPEDEAPRRVIDPSKPMVALTFDDGPHGVYSDQILDVLEACNAAATFFEVGVNVAAHPEVVVREQELGCEVASHSYSHKNLGKMKKSAILADLDAADQAFIAAGVDAPNLVRPPYGEVNSAVKSGTDRTIVTWSVDTLDWKSKNAKKVISFVQNYGDLDGQVVLMHSIYQSTVDAVEVLVPWLQEQGYQLVTVTELMAYYYGQLPEANTLYGYSYFTRGHRTDTPLDLYAAEQEEAPAA